MKWATISGGFGFFAISRHKADVEGISSEYTASLAANSSNATETMMAQSGVSISAPPMPLAADGSAQYPTFVRAMSAFAYSPKIGLITRQPSAQATTVMVVLIEVVT